MTLAQLQAEVVAAVLEVLEEVGESITLTEPTTFNPSTGTATPGTAHANVLASPPAPYETLVKSKDADQSGDEGIVVRGSAVLGFTPKVNWTVNSNGVTSTIVSVKSYLNGVAFILRCKR